METVAFALALILFAQSPDLDPPQDRANDPFARTPTEILDPDGAGVEEPLIFEPRRYALTGARAERFRDLWADLFPDVRADADRAALWIWRERLNDEEREAVRAAGRTLYADLSPDERRDLIARRQEEWLTLSPVARIEARANSALRFDALPEAYRDGFRLAALFDIAPDLVIEFASDEEQDEPGLLDRLIEEGAPGRGGAGEEAGGEAEDGPGGR